jgi:ferredoxin--NADP+ reductase
VDPGTGQPVAGLYVAGWIKRGPTGVIGTNKPDAVETVMALIEDATSGALRQPPQPDASSAEALLRERQPDLVSYADWLRLDALEISNGQGCGRPRLKFTNVEEMLKALGRTVTAR